MGEKLNILFLEDVTQSISGVTYYRMLVPARELENRGHSIRFNAELLVVDKDGKNPKIIIDDIEWADTVVFPRYFNFSPNVIVSIMNYCKQLNKRVIYETDDYLYKIPDHNPVANVVNKESSQRLIKFLEENADEKTVTTQRLHDLLGGVICPNSIDTEVWDGLKNSETGKLVIGWAGGWTHQKDLELIVPVLQKLKKKYRFEIRLFGYDPEIPHHKLYYKYFEWANVINYPKRLAELGFDIGIAPLVDDEFNQFKSNIKWLEYAMLETPIVASALPPYEMIKDGEDGFLATTLAEWEEKLERLIVDAQLRREMGKKAKERVLKEYNIKETIREWEKAYNG